MIAVLAVVVVVMVMVEGGPIRERAARWCEQSGEGNDGQSVAHGFHDGPLSFL
jgi:hypothetical protein